MEGVVNVDPLPIAVPPEAAANHSTIPVLAVAERFTVPAPQRAFPLLAVMVGVVLMVAITALRGDEVHAPEVVDT